MIDLQWPETVKPIKKTAHAMRHQEGDQLCGSQSRQQKPQLCDPTNLSLHSRHMTQSVYHIDAGCFLSEDPPRKQVNIVYTCILITRDTHT